jgi:hypothetical protein
MFAAVENSSAMKGPEVAALGAEADALAEPLNEMAEVAS